MVGGVACETVRWQRARTSQASIITNGTELYTRIVVPRVTGTAVVGGVEGAEHHGIAGNACSVHPIMTGKTSIIAVTAG